MTTEPQAIRTRASRRARALAPTAGLVVAVLLMAANLRPAVTGLGPVLDQVRDSLRASPAFLSVLTALPGLCFGLAGFLAPVLARRAGLGRALAVSLGLLTVGLLGRVVDGPVVLLTGTFVACAGIAICNVLLPVVIRESFPRRIGLLTGLYTAVLQGAAALASVVTPALDSLLSGWRTALAAWAVLAAIALIGWLLAARPGPAPDPAVEEAADIAPAGDLPPVEARGRSLTRNKLAWAITLFFGLQAMFAYSVMGWLAQVLMAAGVSREVSGVMLGTASLIGVPLSLVVTPIASRGRSQSAWLAGITATGVLGVLGLMLAPRAAPWLWTVLMGVGMGVFSLAVALISLRTANAADTRSLSTMTQSVGYLLAAVGPLVFGMLHGLTGGWAGSLVFLLVGQAIQIVVGLVAGRDRFV
jgi:CP family cyanate transporter-like MFS transporter